MALKDWKEISNKHVIIYTLKKIKKYKNLSYLEQIQIFLPPLQDNFLVKIDTIDKKTKQAKQINKSFKSKLQALKFAKSYMRAH